MNPRRLALGPVLALAACTALSGLDDKVFDLDPTGGAGGLGNSGGGGAGGGGASSGGGGTGGTGGAGGTIDPGDALWSLSFGSDWVDTSGGLAVDGDGNAYVAGQVTADVTFAATTHTNQGEDDLILAKLTADGTPEWLRGIGAAQAQRAWDLAVTPSGLAVVVGDFWGTGITFVPGGTSYDAVGQDGFVVAFDDQGVAQWEIVATGTSDQYLTSAAAGSGDDVVVAGVYYNDDPIQPSFGTASLPAVSHHCGFVVKLSSDGERKGPIRRIDGLDKQEPRAVAVDLGGNFVVAGWFGDAIAVGNLDVQAIDEPDAFVVKYDTSSDFLWALRFGGVGDEWFEGVAVNPAGDIIAVGHMTGTANCGQGERASAGGDDMVIVKYAADGSSCLFSERYGDTADQRAEHVAIDGAGNVLVAGTFGGTLQIGTHTLVAGSDEDLFILKLDADFDPIWTKSYGSSTTTVGSALAVDATDHLLVGGHFVGSLDFGCCEGELVADGTSDLFVAKLAP